MSYQPSESFVTLATNVSESGTTETMTPKDLLSHFGVRRRNKHIKVAIDKELGRLGVKTEPDYKSEYLYGKIILKRETKSGTNEDFIQRLKVLDAANRAPVSVTKNDSIACAMTLMMSHDYSQLPVLNSPTAKTVDGIISWRSIGWATAKGRAISSVKDVMSKDVTIVKYETPLLEAVDIITAKEVVLVQKQDKSISGLLTITDVADFFFGQTQPFLYLEQIETCVRTLLEGKFSIEELKAVQFGDDQREVRSVSDLNFNEYIQLLRKGDFWSKLKLPLDQKEFTKKLDEVREIRNDVMHFSSDKLEIEQQDTLRHVAQFLREILS